MVYELCPQKAKLSIGMNKLLFGDNLDWLRKRENADFRTADMAAGGQGAPLVPMVDYLLLRDARKGTVALNVGGIANFTVIPAGAKPEQVFGFDTGPGNMIIDGLVRHFTKGQKAYDAGGRWAAKGQSDRTPA